VRAVAEEVTPTPRAADDEPVGPDEAARERFARSRANSFRLTSAWFETFFETDEWLLLDTTVDPERIESETAFVAEQLPPGGRVLDPACGTGRIAVPLAERGFDVAGLDISRRALEVAREQAPQLDLRHGDLRELPWPDASFDAVINL
jgi:2-polyprenyl-3-methyl-5-hydroxy-6-metoxy-1,4-benzoquinol methylase